MVESPHLVWEGLTVLSHAQSPTDYAVTNFLAAAYYFLTRIV